MPVAETNNHKIQYVIPLETIVWVQYVLHYPLGTVDAVGILHQKLLALWHRRRVELIVHRDRSVVDALDQFEKSAGEWEE